MSRPQRTTLVLAACGSLLASTGCTRTTDGSVVMNTPPMPRLFAGRSQEPAPMPEQTAMLTQLPPPPAPAPAQPQRRTHNRSIPVAGFKVQPVKAPFERDNPEQPLNCRNETSPQGRVKVVCQ